MIGIVAPNSLPYAGDRIARAPVSEFCDVLQTHYPAENGLDSWSSIRTPAVAAGDELADPLTAIGNKVRGQRPQYFGVWAKLVYRNPWPIEGLVVREGDRLRALACGT